MALPACHLQFDPSHCDLEKSKQWPGREANNSGWWITLSHLPRPTLSFASLPSCCSEISPQSTGAQVLTCNHRNRTAKCGKPVPLISKKQVLKVIIAGCKRYSCRFVPRGVRSSNVYSVNGENQCKFCRFAGIKCDRSGWGGAMGCTACHS